MKTTHTQQVSGSMTMLAGERVYAIRNVDQLPPFFISLVSAYDHWMFIASNGGLTAGRVSPDIALFPYVTVDKIYDSVPHTGSKTILRVNADRLTQLWEPFNREHDARYRIQRNLYKNWQGNKLTFEEINLDLELIFRYSWASSEDYGFIRRSELENTSASARDIDFVDGLQNLLPAGTPRFTQANSSYLVDAYKWNEVDADTGLACFTLYSAITDRAEPCESLRATTVFCLGLDRPNVLLSEQHLAAFRAGQRPKQEASTRGLRGAYLISASINLAAYSSRQWQLVANTEQTQSQAVATQLALANPAALSEAIELSIESGSDALNRIMGAADGLQHTQDENLAAHHYANVLFNVMRGGIFDDQYCVNGPALRSHFIHFNRPLAKRFASLIEALPECLSHKAFMAVINDSGDPQLLRLALEYLPLTFGRRHGDPSRPWNQFTIKLKDDSGHPILAYEGNWRDIFQNWEALLFSYPEFIESVIAKFVNASTIDGYNPYRITEAGIDWEVEDADDPWSYIGYWGDHQIIYLLKLLELSQQFHPQALPQLLTSAVFAYANVPYKLNSFEAMLDNAKNTVTYDADQAAGIEERVADTGADGKLLLDKNGQVYLVTLLEKLLVPLLSKLGNLVVDGGIWLNTQRPEWNDANNALVGQGLSMVTLYYLRRYICFLQPLVQDLGAKITLSTEVQRWLLETSAALKQLQPHLFTGPLSSGLRFDLLTNLGRAASAYRRDVYKQQGFSGSSQLDAGQLIDLLDVALTAIDHSITTNRQTSGLYNAYNLLALDKDSADIDTLYPMLEGQVAALSSGAIAPADAVNLLQTLYASRLYREDQHSFLLYPDRETTGFLQKSVIDPVRVENSTLLCQMLLEQDTSIIERDGRGCLRFNAQLTNVGQLNTLLETLPQRYGPLVVQEKAALRGLYEEVFDHQSFTGRSGGMFGFEGLGSIYWHMVSKLLLAVQEQFVAARAAGTEAATVQQLGQLYYRIRDGLGFNKTPAEYGAFPNDPYSHSPGHIGAQQPGMTGQVKEEIITRFTELGLRVNAGQLSFDPALLRAAEFTLQPQIFRYLDIAGDWQNIDLPAFSLAFTWCQVPIVYHLASSEEADLTTTLHNGDVQQWPGMTLASDMAAHLFQRDGVIRRIDLTLGPHLLFND